MRSTTAEIDPDTDSVLNCADLAPTPAAGDSMPPPAKPNYGIDAPNQVFLFGILGVIFTFLGIFIGSGQTIAAAIGPWIVALLCFGACGYMLRSSKIVKQRIWRYRLDELQMRGNERALDVGCGRGLVAVELAKRLPRGEVVGIDIWRNRDLSGNSRANAQLNLEIEGVADRVEIVDADMTKMPFDDGEFDVVTASLVIHNAALAEGRRDAMHEIMRVTKPGGRVVIVDNLKTAECLIWLNDADWDDVKRGPSTLAYYPPVRVVTATKPRQSARRAKK